MQQEKNYYTYNLSLNFSEGTYSFLFLLITVRKVFCFWEYDLIIFLFWEFARKKKISICKLKRKSWNEKQIKKYCSLLMILLVVCVVLVIYLDVLTWKRLFECEPCNEYDYITGQSDWSINKCSFLFKTVPIDAFQLVFWLLRRIWKSLYGHMRSTSQESTLYIGIIPTLY